MEAKMHMKEWLVAQIESGGYEGLCWEDDSRSMFRIPWKHAAKKDYKQTEDAALFKAWAVYKGKHKEGRDRADPTMWKTRLRCALNKSTDFQEVPERNQLDIAEPYKVYLIQHNRPAESPLTKGDHVTQTLGSPRNPAFPVQQLSCQKESFHRSKEEVKPLPEVLMREHMYCELTGNTSRDQSRAPLLFLSPTLTISDFRMQVVLLYRGQRVMKATTRSPEGCFILQGRVPLGSERIYGPCSAQRFSFPPPGSAPAASLPPWMAEAMNRLLRHLERGVLLWVAPDGVFIKRFCRGRVYWSGPGARHADRPNKLERDKTVKLLDAPTFLSELQRCLQGTAPTPSYEIELCFGEEYPDPNVPQTRKLIMAKVVPLFAVELLQRLEEKRPVLTTDTGGEKM
ncbi:interferon regulatory factor 10 [Pseudoliparis swirei]|uniref:interferon regulatory factor 10 n=1 Tax=Pseudoliparis swirei TaxID=2059687 RepID=UPI0024BDE7E1|nr:interferon regulatory factor 10 [Pseudoliparis swirei]